MSQPTTSNRQAIKKPKGSSGVNSPTKDLPNTMDQIDPRPPNLRRVRFRLFALALGACFGLVATLLFMFFLGPGHIPELTAARFTAASAKWQSVKLPNYQIEITVQGRQPGRYWTQVRNGKVVEAKFNNNALTNPRTMSTWTVDGMFRTIDYDVQSQINRGPQEPELTLRAEFDAELGYPKKYQRIQWGSLNELTWEVSKFEVLNQE
ncbi:MAG: hypothetical protein GY768_04420 [Planctomycetaceae bacterium]|nr:hypothetical protein [Planctomycetaceae bacterium]